MDTCSTAARALLLRAVTRPLPCVDAQNQRPWERRAFVEAEDVETAGPLSSGHKALGCWLCTCPEVCWYLWHLLGVASRECIHIPGSLWMSLKLLVDSHLVLHVCLNYAKYLLYFFKAHKTLIKYLGTHAETPEL